MYARAVGLAGFAPPRCRGESRPIDARGGMRCFYHASSLCQQSSSSSFRSGHNCPIDAAAARRPYIDARDYLTKL